MNAEEVLTIVRNGLGGEPVSVLLDGVKRFDIAVRLDDATRTRWRRCADSAAHGDRRAGAAVARWPTSVSPRAIRSSAASSCSAMR
jgi:Cu/Ag efflux pump CusA